MLFTSQQVHKIFWKRICVSSLSSFSNSKVEKVMMKEMHLVTEYLASEKIPTHSLSQHLVSLQSLYVARVW